MYDLVLSFICSLSVTYLLIPSIIEVARLKNIMDVPEDRRSHTTSTPSLGGLAIFAGVVFSVVLWTPYQVFGDLQYILSAFVIIFLIGARDDIIPLSPLVKLIGQTIAAAIVVLKSNVVVTSMYGLFGVYELPYVISVVLTIFTIIVIINTFNLIDGINGLSASVTGLLTLFLGCWFFLVEESALSIISFSLAGSVIAFLRFNVTPAQIFMGDTGSLFCGLVLSILMIKFIELHQVLEHSPYSFKSVPAVAVGLLILPLFDTLRVFVMRISRGRSPLSPDRLHIHHLLIDLGMSHMQATGILILFNTIFIYLVIKLQNIGSINLLVILGLSALMLTTLLYFIVENKRKVNSV